MFEYPDDIKHLPPGMYLGMFHGRNDPAQVMDDWGFNGPILGPITAQQVTYQSHYRIRFKSLLDAKNFFPGVDDEWVDLTFHEGLLVYGGKYYGDYTLFTTP